MVIYCHDRGTLSMSDWITDERSAKTKSKGDARVPYVPCRRSLPFVSPEAGRVFRGSASLVPSPELHGWFKTALGILSTRLCLSKGSSSWLRTCIVLSEWHGYVVIVCRPCWCHIRFPLLSLLPPPLSSMIQMTLAGSLLSVSGRKGLSASRTPSAPFFLIIPSILHGRLPFHLRPFHLHIVLFFFFTRNTDSSAARIVGSELWDHQKSCTTRDYQEKVEPRKCSLELWFMSPCTSVGLE